MVTNVDKIVGDVIDSLRPLVREAVQRADSDARSELLAQVTKAIGLEGVKAVATTSVKRKPGRPSKDQSAQAPSDTGKPKKEIKAKRVLSDSARESLAANLKKARESRSEKVSPVNAAGFESSTTDVTQVKRGRGRPKKVQVVETPAVFNAE